MNKLVRFGLGLLMGVFSSSVISDTINDVLIKDITVRANGNNSIIHFDQNFPNGCSDGGYWGVMNTTQEGGRNLGWAAILSAATTGKAVTVTTDGCEFHNRISTISIKY